MARNLDRWLGGARLRSVEVHDEKFDREQLESLAGTMVLRAWRRAKYAVVDLNDERHLVIHYRMTGKTVIDPEGVRTGRLRLVPDDRAPVVFEDTRRFGEVWVVSSADLDPFFLRRRLGPEPWPHLRDGDWWAAQLSGLRGPIKPALMRQDRVAGLGNIIASEVCFVAGIDPRTPVPALPVSAWQAISESVQSVIGRTLTTDGGDEIMYVNMGGENHFSVYGKEGSPCPSCGSSIERITQSARSSYFCPDCQLG